MRLKTIHVPYWNKVPKYFTGIVKHISGSTTYLKNGKWHRENGEARTSWNFDHTISTPQYYFDGQQYTKEAYWTMLYKMGKISKKKLFLEML